MKNAVFIEGRRDAYGWEDIINRTMTVGELIERLSDYPDDCKVILKNDRGYTYGSIDYYSFEEDDD